LLLKGATSGERRFGARNRKKEKKERETPGKKGSGVKGTNGCVRLARISKALKGVLDSGGDKNGHVTVRSGTVKRQQKKDSTARNPSVQAFIKRRHGR